MKRIYSSLLLLVLFYLPASAQLPPITGTMITCVGQVTTLSIAFTGGTWSSGATSVATVNAMGAVRGISGGTAVISYIVSESNFATAEVTVNGAGVITGPSSVCIGSTIELSDLTPGGTWSAAGGKASVNSSGVVTGTAAGVATISYKLTGCATAFATKMITVLALPANITGAAALCSGNTTLYSDATPGGVWSGGNSNASIDGGGLVTGLAAGTATISYTNTDGCSKTKTITVNQTPDALTGNTGSICPAATLSLESTTPGGSWSSSSAAKATVGTSGVVTGVSGGTARITYLLGTCSTSTIVTVDALPTTVKASAAAICQGNTATLTGTPTGGDWSTVSSSVSITGTVVTGVSEGTATLTYTNAAGCYKTTAITVNPLPAAITGNTGSVCQGLTLDLDDVTTGGTWSSSSPAQASVDVTTGFVTTGTAGTARITYKLSTSCIAITVVTVNAKPTTARLNYSSICVGGIALLNGAPLGGTWTSSNDTVSIIDSIVPGSFNAIAVGVLNGTATLTYTNAAGCYKTAAVTVNPQPSTPTITGPSSVAVGNSITLTGIAAGGVWSISNTDIATITIDGGVVTGVNIGTVTVGYTLSNSCGSAVRNTTITVTEPEERMAHSTQTGAQATIYPNPTTGVINVDASFAGTLSVYSFDGRVIGEYPVNAGKNSIALPRSLAPGAYMARFTNVMGKTDQFKITKE